MPIETDVYKVWIDPSTFDALSPTERALACIVGNAQNEIATLGKLVAWTGGSPFVEYIDNDARDAMRHCVLRLLILKLRELYRTFTVDITDKKNDIRSEVLALLDKSHQFDDALGKDGYLRKIRNELAGHYRLEFWEENCSHIDSELYKGYRLSDRLAGSTFYSFADLISMLTMFDIKHEYQIRDAREAYEKFHRIADGVFSILRAFLLLMDEILTSLLDIGDNCQSETHRIRCELAFEDIKLPWLAPFAKPDTR